MLTWEDGKSSWLQWDLLLSKVQVSIMQRDILGKFSSAGIPFPPVFSVVVVLLDREIASGVSVLLPRLPLPAWITRRFKGESSSLETCTSGPPQMLPGLLPFLVCLRGDDTRVGDDPQGSWHGRSWLFKGLRLSRFGALWLAGSGCLRTLS